MNRFRKKRKRKMISVHTLFPFLTFIPLFVLFYQGITSVSQVNIEEQEKSLRKAIEQNVVHCYAVEGAYPPSLDYLEKNYGIIYDKSKFFVDYQPIGTNILPDITIIRLESDSEQP